jgi:hypothetical protein
MLTLKEKNDEKVLPQTEQNIEGNQMNNENATSIEGVFWSDIEIATTRSKLSE